MLVRYALMPLRQPLLGSQPSRFQYSLAVHVRTDVEVASGRETETSFYGSWQWRAVLGRWHGCLNLSREVVGGVAKFCVSRPDNGLATDIESFRVPVSAR